MTARLTVARPAGGYRDRAREYVIEVDGHEVGRLQPNCDLTVEIPSDQEVAVRAAIDWTGSPTWRGQLAEDEHAHIEVAPKSAFTGLMNLFGGNTWIRIRRLE